MKPYIIFSIYALSSLFSHASHAEQDSQQQLSQHPYWRILLRYDSQHHNQWQSSINQANFFISPHGKTNPEAELQATLQALLHPDNTLKADATVECRFRARSAWLRKQLKINPDTLPIKTCPALDTWLKGINPHQATLVFAADFTNNPSSMFGHTLLRL